MLTHSLHVNAALFKNSFEVSNYTTSIMVVLNTNSM